MAGGERGKIGQAFQERGRHLPSGSRRADRFVRDTCIDYGVPVSHNELLSSETRRGWIIWAMQRQWGVVEELFIR